MGSVAGVDEASVGQSGPAGLLDTTRPPKVTLWWVVCYVLGMETFTGTTPRPSFALKYGATIFPPASDGPSSSPHLTVQSDDQFRALTGGPELLDAGWQFARQLGTGLFVLARVDGRPGWSDKAGAEMLPVQVAWLESGVHATADGDWQAVVQLGARNLDRWFARFGAAVKIG